MDNWPVYAVLGAALLVAVGLIMLVAGMVKRRWLLTLASAAVVVVSSMAFTTLTRLTYWDKPECALANGQLDESREECRM